MISSTVLLVALTTGSGDAELFSALDRNQDGRITQNEISDSQRPWFARALRVSDANGDGSLTAEELQGALTDSQRRPLPKTRRSGRRNRGPGAGRMKKMDPSRLDRNGDGMITIDEVPEPGKRRFQTVLERTGRDAISVEELTRLMQSGKRPGDRMRDDRMMKQMQGDPDAAMRRRNDKKTPPYRKRGGKNADGKRRPGPGRKGPQGMALFDRFDTNKDGMISREEAPRRLRSLFPRLDQNEDGQLSPQELEAARPNRKR